ncbi:2-phosphosulfolactate phosphatase [Rubrobacter xylanophilus DSM 9941]|uniref:Probable 2-phosphosulfolactate phosphatase n=1 Tax=Rubrobacter xylanophilus (strain DSM 9941 / JCM 11954 / NBRC 16129 / PRD-1) TaxID=266117 RepID=Q1AY10_RUBXD|nr:2-phosphosulfolactate phosphatase [Rubrobacter xylanophilus]ABG03718.1 2-phosphosulfolactate phosphatase [Rubrobacter xylanophilus DSM 9941]
MFEESLSPGGGRMLVRYAGGVGGARSAARAGAVAVIVDAFRASATLAALVHRGAVVVPVASVEEALALPADLRVGERGGAKVAGFELGNSPTGVLEARIEPGSRVVMSTTNGTRIVEAASGAAEVYAGSFVNAGALARALASGFPGAEVVVVGCGWRGHRSSEDEAAAGAIIHRLRRLGAGADPRARAVEEAYLSRPLGRLAKNAAARRLARLGYARDVEFCLKEDVLPAVPRLVGGAFVRAGAPAKNLLDSRGVRIYSEVGPADQTLQTGSGVRQSAAERR